MAEFNEAAVNQLIASDPQLQAILQQARQDPRTRGAAQNKTGYQQAMAAYEPQISARLQQLGVTLPQGYGVSLMNGTLGHDNWFFRNSPWLMPLILGGAAGVTALAGEGAAAGAAGGSGAAASEAGSTAALGPVAAEGGTAAATVPSSLAANAGSTGVLGTLGKWSGPIGDIGKVLSTGAAANAAGRRADAANNGRAIAENNAAKVQAAKYNLDLPTARAEQVSRGEVLNTMQDAPLTGDARIDKFSGGGLRPSAFGPQSRAAGAELSRQAMNGLMNPSQDRLTPQEIPSTSGSTIENIMAGAGIGADIFSLLSKYGGANGSR